MRVLLVNPPRFNGISVIREERCEITERYSVLPPYGLLQIASILRREGHEVQLLDANGWDLNWAQVDKKIAECSYDVIVFKFTPTTFDYDNKTASLSKQHHSGAYTIGICWTLRTVPQDVLKDSPDLDIYVMHEYETVTCSVINALSKCQNLTNVRGIAYRNGAHIEITRPAEASYDWDSLPMPAYDLLPSLDYYYINTPHGSPFTTMYTSKGCPYSCIYCTVRRTPVKKRSAESILNEIRYLKKTFNVRMISFFDETFTLDRVRVMAICQALKDEQLKVTWYCNTRVNLVDAELLKMMYAAGCRGLSYGIESGSQTILNNAHKGTTVEQGKDAIKWAKKAGLKVLCSFIIGLPGENQQTITETIDFVKQTLPTGAQFNVAVPYPSSELFEVALAKGWIKAQVDWRSMYQHDAIMRTDELSCEDLDNARQLSYKILYSNPKWWLQNIYYVLKHTEDLPLATKYSLKVVKNITLNKMAHAH